MADLDTANIYDLVRQHYSSASRSTSVKYGEAVAKSFGYSAEELASIPQDSNLGLSCGNPLVIASLKEGETVIDLGSGAGFDVFLAATKIGPSGRAIGIDMNDDMLARANKIKSTRPGPQTENITFLKGNITAVPLPPATADCIISNCVINLVPGADKPLVFREMHRLLKKGGRVAVSDILAKKALPETLRADMAMYVGCIAGASEVCEYEAWLTEAGFSDVMIVDTGADLNVYLETSEDGQRKDGCCAPAATDPVSTDANSKSCVPAAGDGCCGPDTVAAASIACSSAGSGAAAPATATGGGCPVPAGMALKKTDLNEFVGK
ncbi:putative arsenite methyltransferase [Madurella mycetomatis]|uniref:Arsenite methyltransferase n=1 Tax=Madurella mycetomatis TaxID=100816 RepID=A0A175WCY2_9PEZI|nr:putative arsenite methyltransferase [Madurella mycetomatis]